LPTNVLPHKGDEQKFWFGELQSLCAPCHSKHKHAVEHRGFMTGCDVHGWPLDRAHPAWRDRG
jgi:5-methylcytosine-specific restriction protein A